MAVCPFQSATNGFFAETRLAPGTLLAVLPSPKA